MRITPSNQPRGISLLECIVYTAVFLTIATMGLLTYYRAEENNRRLRQNAEDILRTLRAGERWREDIRHATGPIRLAGPDTAPALLIPLTNGTLKYEFRDGAVWRQDGPKPHSVLPGVLHSRMEPDPRQHVSAWRWEIELKPHQRVGRVKPLFTFEAVAKGIQP
jgi:hypothetical protein